MTQGRCNLLMGRGNISFVFKLLFGALLAVEAHRFNLAFSVFLYGYPDEQVISTVGVIHKIH